MLHREKEIASNLIRSALACGWSVSVNDGPLEGEGEWTVKKSYNFKIIFDALETTGADMLRFRDGAGNNKGDVILVWGNDDCLIHDHSYQFEVDEDGHISCAMAW